MDKCHYLNTPLHYMQGVLNGRPSTLPLFWGWTVDADGEQISSENNTDK